MKKIRVTLMLLLLGFVLSTTLVRADSPTVETQDGNGNVKDWFLLKETVYIKGSGYEQSTWYPLCVVKDFDLYEAAHFVTGTGVRYELDRWYTEGSPPQGTVEAWIKPHEYQDPSLETIFLNFQWYSTDTPPQAGYLGGLSIWGGKLSYGIWEGGRLTGTTDIPLNEWTHVAVAWGPDGTTLYVNGRVDASSPYDIYPAFLPKAYIYLNWWGVLNFGCIDELYISKVKETPKFMAEEITPDTNRVLLDHFNGATQGHTIGSALTYLPSLFEWMDGMIIPKRVAGTELRIATDKHGDIPADKTSIAWFAPDSWGRYDIVIDVNQNGKYDKNVDALDDSDIFVTAGFAVVPEVPFGTIMGFLSMFTVLAGFIGLKRFRPKVKN